MASGSNEEAVLAIAITGLAVIAKRRLRKRKMWQRMWLERREKLGCFQNLMQELAFEDREGYRRWIRMDAGTFEELVALVSPLIERQDTVMRKAIPAAERVALTLRYLATGETQSSLSYQFRIAQNTISGIIPDVCHAIIQCLHSYIQVPDTEEAWKNIAREFWEKWNYPMCLGAMDGKHVKIQPPPNSGTMYRNYKSFFSIILFALVDANLCFTFVDVGTNGKTSDGGVWEKCKLKSAIQNNALNIPKPAKLPGCKKKEVPYVIVADDAFPLTTYIMKPYPGSNLKKKNIIHNYRLSRARRVVENAFGVLAARFQVFRAPILTSVARCKLITLAACYLHNFLVKKSGSIYMPEGSIDIENTNSGKVTEGNWRESQSTMVSCSKTTKRGKEEAKDVRNRFCDFFNNEGAVPWQENYCLLH